MSSPLCDGFLCFARNDGKAYRPTITPIPFGAARYFSSILTCNAGAVGKQHGVTVLEGKRHDARIAPRALTAEQLRPPDCVRGPYACLPQMGLKSADEATFEQQ